MAVNGCQRPDGSPAMFFYVTQVDRIIHVVIAMLAHRIDTPSAGGSRNTYRGKRKLARAE